VLHFDLLQEWWHQTPGPVKSFISAGIGAIFGAWLTSRAQSKRAIVRELHALRAAQALCFSIGNRVLSLKKQHILKLKNDYDQATAAYEAAIVDETTTAIDIRFDLQVLSKIDFPIENLEKIIFDKCLLNTQGLATLATLADATHELNSAIEFRTELISKGQPPDLEQKIAAYLGLYLNGSVDERFRNNIDALYSYTNDCIFFSISLDKAICERENAIRRRNWQFWLPGTKLAPIDWKFTEHQLIPESADYAGWTRGFVRRESVWKRALAWTKKLKTDV